MSKKQVQTQEKVAAAATPTALGVGIESEAAQVTQMEGTRLAPASDRIAAAPFSKYCLECGQSYNICRCEDIGQCPTCGGAGKVTTEDFESYLGANYKPCPECGADPCTGEPPVS